MARAGPKSGGSSTMDSIAAHEGEEVGKMKRSTGEGFWRLYRKVPRGKMDKGHRSSLRLEMIILIGMVSFAKLTNCQCASQPISLFSVSSSHHFPCPITNFALKEISITHRIVF
jgi:hypothetical protein